MSVAVRALEERDVLPLAAVLERAYKTGQNFELRLRNYLRRERVHPLVAERDGEPVGFVCGIDYGTHGYVALMGVDPAVQRSGAGSALLGELCEWADTRGFRGLELDATESGAPLYERFGFHDAGITAVYERTEPGNAPDVAALRIANLADPADRRAIQAYDRIAFGADRRVVLELLFDLPGATAFVADRAGFDGYVVAQPATNLIGPLVAHDANVAALLLGSASALMTFAHRVNVPRETPAAEDLVRQLGYRYARALRHMVRGALPPGARERLFARINLGAG